MYRVFIFALCVSTVSARDMWYSTRIRWYIHRSLITSLETSAVDAADCNRRATAISFLSRLPVLSSPCYGIRNSCSRLLFTAVQAEARPDWFPRGWTRQPAVHLVAGASSSRASERAGERSPVLDGATKREANRGIVHAPARSRAQRPWKQSAFVLSHTPTYAE